LDLSQAQRDAFTAEANAAQSQSDLATSLLALQKASGVALLEANK
jgi:outer membrane protein TolC